MFRLGVWLDSWEGLEGRVEVRGLSSGFNILIGFGLRGCFWTSWFAGVLSQPITGKAERGRWQLVPRPPRSSSCLAVDSAIVGVLSFQT